ncbi:alpha/beta-hydrolase [Auricularia subglabra TFB-10046 SS5]|uniref:Alpha/beta-hydrolase n=1 Tax=Auricularia subglabra (strain TFB-10046 / SS5) TaxID=717982 RepID=J0WWL0_AURST|nr:alpha/beta-hydrolase [Auricularia subglabra TFB-10046 SS5]
MASGQHTVKPFKVDLFAAVPRLKAQLAETQLPMHNPIPGGEDNKWGITLARLTKLRDEWLSYDWAAEEKRLNSYKHFTTEIDGTTIHFVHEKSGRDGAIPLIITHGWPGSFNEYLAVLRPLLEASVITLSDGTKKTVSFDVVLPSIPGFVFSSVPPTVEGRNLKNTAKFWNTLMVDVLGYTRGYAVAGSDYGSVVSWHAFNQFPETVRGAYLNGFPFPPIDSDQVAKDNQTLSEFERLGLNLMAERGTSDMGYYAEQSTKPDTIGLALQDNALGQLAWIGEKFYSWSDPTGQGEMTSKDILTGVSLYFLTKSFLSSVFQYAHNPSPFEAPRKSNNASPLGYGHFKWEMMHWPRYYIAQFGNLVFYREHEKGAHFPGTENPTEYVQDIRDFLGEHFSFRN